MFLSKPDSRAALMIAHPSHELRVHGWLERAQPLTFVLTDGSGRNSQPRIANTTAVLDRTGARPGPVFGAITDVDLYRAILEQNFAVFLRIVDVLTESLVAERIDYVVGDAEEGYSSAHDLCRILVDAAISSARIRHERVVESFDFLVIGAPEEPNANASAIWIHLDEGEFVRKVAAARAYNPEIAAEIDSALRGERFQGIRRFSEPHTADTVDDALVNKTLESIEAIPEMKERVSAVLDGVDLAAFRVECLRPTGHAVATAPGDPRYFELYGEQLVEAGRYREVIRYRQHLVPIKDALRRHVESR